MMSYSQLTDLSKKLNAPESIVFREYIQVIFLENLYSLLGSEKIIFKGGTAVHLMYQAPRFSEDLDFTVLMNKLEFDKFIKKVFNTISLSYEITFKERKTITGKRYLLTANPEVIKSPTFINLDFSFRESVKMVEKSPLITPYPTVIASTIYYMGKDEIIAEKIRAILTRQKGRDIYDLHYLLNQGGVINKELLESKFAYYHDKNISLSGLEARINAFSIKIYSDDLKPFLTYRARTVLERDYEILKSSLINKIKDSL